MKRPSHTGNVLVVEDDVGTAEFLKSILEEHGFGVKTAPSRDLAVNWLSRYLYGVILLDIAMPGMALDQFVAEVRQNSPHSRIVLMTAFGNAQEEAQRLHIPYWIAKPFDPLKLLTLLEKLTPS